MTAPASSAAHAAATTAEPVRVETPEPGVLLLTLARPQARNSLSLAMMEALHAGILAAGRNAAVHAIVLAAEGPAFSAGHDLKELTARRADEDGGRAFFADTMSRCSALMQAIVACPKPVIAAVHTTATAAGCQLVASCDMAVAAEGTRFGVNGVNIGLFCSTPMVALSRNVPRKIAFEMLTTGAFIDARRAAEVGLVNRVVPAGALAAETRTLAETVAAKLTAAVRIGKRAFHDQIEMTRAQAYDHAAKAMVENMLWRDTEEGISAFLAKRAPDWG